jgi:hypothetical protein
LTKDAEMTIPTLLAATWKDGVFAFAGEARRHEFAGHAVRALAPDPNGGVLAIVDGHSLWRRTREGEWSSVVASELDLACLAVVGDVIYLGTEDARVLRIGDNGAIDPLRGFETVAGRDTWYAGSALINGQVVGPPLGVRSMTVTADGAALLVNVHVGGIPRSTDGGATWAPTIAVNSDVHEVCAHPVLPGVVIAASAMGLCVSHDGGATWTIEQEGLHASYCSAVAFSGNDMLVAASTDHFATRGAVYRRTIGDNNPLQPVSGLPQWLAGIVDTGGIATLGSAIAIADGAGNLYTSADGGQSWLHREKGLPAVSKVLLI